MRLDTRSQNLQAELQNRITLTRFRAFQYLLQEAPLLQRLSIGPGGTPEIEVDYLGGVEEVEGSGRGGRGCLH
jgi:hypothetical protein